MHGHSIRGGMQFYDFDHDVFQKALIDCVQEGSLSQADLDEAVRSVLRVKFALGLFDHPFVDPALNARFIGRLLILQFRSNRRVNP